MVGLAGRDNRQKENSQEWAVREVAPEEESVRDEPPSYTVIHRLRVIFIEVRKWEKRRVQKVDGIS